jgi:hypothetical protein
MSELQLNSEQLAVLKELESAREKFFAVCATPYSYAGPDKISYDAVAHASITRLDQMFDFLVKGIKCVLPALNDGASIDRMEHQKSLNRYLKAWSGFDKGVRGWLDAVAEEVEGEDDKDGDNLEVFSG